MGNRQRSPQCPTGFGFCCFLSGSKKSFPRRQRRPVPGNGRCGEEGRQPPRSWGPDSWLWDLRRLQKARVVSGNEWPASDRHAVSCGITNRPGAFPRSPREPIPAYCYKSWDSRRLLASLELALALKKKKKNHHLPFFFFLILWLVQGPRNRLCCWVCVPHLFFHPEASGCIAADCLEPCRRRPAGVLPCRA